MMEASSSNHVSIDSEPVYYWSQDKKTLWCSVPEIDGIRDVPATKFHITGRLIGDAASVYTAEECFLLFFTSDMLESMVRFTNENIKAIQEGTSKKSQGREFTDEVELKAFLGILILSGIYLYEDVKELFENNGFGSDIFRATLSMNRYQFLIKCFRFSPDSVRHVTEFLEDFNKNCRYNFQVGSYASLEEHVLPYQGQHSVEGVTKIIDNVHRAACLISVRDARVNYTHACVLHREDKEILDPVSKVTDKLMSSDRLIVGGEAFTTIPIVDYFSANDAFYLGRMKNTADQIPAVLLDEGHDNEPCVVYSSSFSLIRHVDIRSKKPVFLLCNLLGVDSAVTEVLKSYDALSGEGNVVDAMCKSYSCAKKTCRWDLAIFFRLLDIACINAQIVFTVASGSSEGVSRRQYIKKLAGELTRPLLTLRISQPSISFSLRQAAAKIIGVKVHGRMNFDGKADVPPPPGNKRRCQLCPKPNDCKSQYSCCSCMRCMCRKRAFLFCKDCINNPGPLD